jgi:hypothetical protein
MAQNCGDAGKSGGEIIAELGLEYPLRNPT